MLLTSDSDFCPLFSISSRAAVALLSPMTLSNPWFLLALLATIGLWKLELIATLLNMSALAPEVPPRLRGIMSEEEHERARDYACVSAKFDLLQSSITLGLFLVFWW